MDEEMRKQSIKEGWELYRRMGSPRFIMAPMVDASELPFRMLGRKYGTELCYSPMIHTPKFVCSERYRHEVFTTCPEEGPLIAQVCGHDPETLIKAGKMIQDQCEAIDLNLGCPQNIAKKGFYGAFLLEDVDKAVECVERMVQELNVPITCKVRLFPDVDATLSMCKRLQDAGCKMLGVHGRTKEMIRNDISFTDFATIRLIKEHMDIPVFTNGGVESYDDALKALELTGCDGVMVAEGLLSDPALFMPPGEQEADLCRRLDIALEYIELVEKYYTHIGNVRGHLLKMLYPFLWVHTELRQKIATAKTTAIVRERVLELRKEVQEAPDEIKYTYPSLQWYRRRWHLFDDSFKDPRDLNPLLEKQRPDQKHVVELDVNI